MLPHRQTKQWTAEWIFLYRGEGGGGGGGVIAGVLLMCTKCVLVSRNDSSTRVATPDRNWKCSSITSHCSNHCVTGAH